MTLKYAKFQLSFSVVLHNQLISLSFFHGPIHQLALSITALVTLSYQKSSSQFIISNSAKMASCLWCNIINTTLITLTSFGLYPIGKLKPS